MFTNALVGWQRDDGSIDCVYCHCEATPSVLGKMLAERFAAEENLEELFKNGNFVSGGDDRSGYQFANLQTGWCRQMKRPQYEPGKPRSTFDTMREFIGEAEDLTHYVYLFTDGGWKWANTLGTSKIVLRQLSKNMYSVNEALQKSKVKGRAFLVGRGRFA